MDPWAAFRPALGLDGVTDPNVKAECRAMYNRWVRTGGFPVELKVRKYTLTWSRGIRRIKVRRIGNGRVHGVDARNHKVKVSVPFAALEVD